MTVSSSGVKTRFAPSPTGFMTIGNYRTALFNYLFALKHKGEMLLRYEDTDQERSSEAFIEQLDQDLSAMGVIFDRKSVLFQSKRQEQYERYYQKLIEKGDLYECFCSKEDLALERKMQQSQKIPPKYSGRCRDLTPSMKQERLEKGLEPVLRFKVPEGKTIQFDDLLMGPKSFLSDLIGDFIVKKADGHAAFFFCNAVDDADSAITHVLRGEDHVTNTPRQILLLEALGLPVPQYGHFPLILGSDHKPLSKRTGSRSIAELLETGHLSEAINNYLARLGHSIESPEVLTLSQLALVFSLDHISSSSAHFDPQQLHYWQKHAFSQLPPKVSISLIGDNCFEVPKEQQQEFWDLVCHNCHDPESLKDWSQALFAKDLTLSLEEFVDYGWSLDVMSFLLENWSIGYEKLVLRLKEDYSLKGKKLFMPLRLLLSTKKDGPPLEDLYNFVSFSLIAHRLGNLKNDYQAA